MAERSEVSGYHRQLKQQQQHPLLPLDCFLLMRLAANVKVFRGAGAFSHFLSFFLVRIQCPSAGEEEYARCCVVFTGSLFLCDVM